MADFSFNNCLSGVLRREVAMGPRETLPVEMTRAQWAGYDDLAVCGYTARELLELVTDQNPTFGPDALGAALAEAVMIVHNARQQDDEILAEFHGFCARQPRNAEGVRRIEAEADRLRAARRRA